MFEYILIAIAEFLVLNIPFVILAILSDKQYNKRSDERYFLNADLFQGLRYQEISFLNIQGQNLKGYKYFKDTDYKAVILLIPGIKNNHTHYLPEIDYFASRGFLVFAFDPAATGLSEGKGSKGLLQIPYDAKSALNYIKQDPELNNKPLFLWGFSNGAYAALALANAPKVLAVASLSAFDDVNKMTADYAALKFGKIAKIIYPYCVIFNRLKYGKNPFGSASSNLKKCSKPVFLTHGTDDKVVPYKNFLRLKKYNSRPQSVSLSIKGGDHWIRYAPKAHRLKIKLKARLENGQGDMENLKRYYAVVCKKINCGLIDQIADFFQNILKTNLQFT
ncbi:MAG TPA: alpha/beta hydrolase [Clostridia bacterium]